MVHTPRLACEQCKRRKIRCDKSSPCLACRNAGLDCHAVERARLPRGKSGKARTQNRMLETRISRIEEMLAQQAEVADTSNSALRTTSPTEPTHGRILNDSCSASEPTTRFIAPEFWEALSSEIYGLRETLADAHDVSDDAVLREATTLDKPLSTTSLLFPLATHGTRTPISLSPKLRNELLALYQERVDTVYKILHWPTVLSVINAKHERPMAASSMHSMEILESSIYFMSICSINADEALDIGLGSRVQALQVQRSHLESLFAGSCLMHDPDVTILQAFVIYLIGVRTCSNSAYTWTLVAIAVRAATALRLGSETTKIYTRFDVEIRRRLLYAIGIIDTHSALDRGTTPIMPSASFQHPPLSINDSGLSPSGGVILELTSSWSEMSHTAMIYEAMICQRKLFELCETTADPWETWPRRLDLVARFEQHVSNVTSYIDNSASPLERLSKLSGKKIVVSLQLLLRRPPYRQSRNAIPPWDDFDVLSEATNVLEQHMQPMPDELEIWAWKNWVQWHALAVVLAELIARPLDPVSERAYKIAVESFRRYAQIVADSDSGMLWRPIAKLMRRVQRARHSACSGASQEQPSDIIPPAPYTNTVSEPSHYKFVEDFEMCDLDQCKGRDGVSNLATQNDRPYYIMEDDIPTNNSGTWLDWDTFLQDLDLGAEIL
ncbi:hypothetical protein FB567DRAFT_632393 [Paraphoma chrysanthemicola]|uniref:Zn(2)-C6 fungal-type domain-containing protein n=1 Tax=Paraphoma chrysanthemicola TaxID=798071 RepID=A0A8K0QX92_9PLEO|nr:hypothetical protein FB567DRAFT_632393 [Paraphoma chrysanthemicola]